MLADEVTSPTVKFRHINLNCESNTDADAVYIDTRSPLGAMASLLMKCTRNKIIAGQCRHFFNKLPNIHSSVFKYDLVVVGGGIVGTATAREIVQRHPNWRVAIVEKESDMAAHQSGHNSGVIHAGIYYKPGSLKAKLCVEGMQLMYDYLDAKNIPYKKCGKLIVATDETEVEQLAVSAGNFFLYIDESSIINNKYISVCQ